MTETIADAINNKLFISKEVLLLFVQRMFGAVNWSMKKEKNKKFFMKKNQDLKTFRAAPHRTFHLAEGTRCWNMVERHTQKNSEGEKREAGREVCLLMAV